jgi:hypothetical protein
MSLATSSDRRLGELYRATLERADGKYFGVEPLQSPGAGRAGHLFVYAGEPSWVFAVVPDAPSGESYRVEARTRSGERHVIGTLLVRDGRGAGGFPLPVDLADVGEVRIIPVDGGPSLEAHIPEGS